MLDPDTGDWEQWEPVESFVESKPTARHYLLNAAAGQLEFGPAIRTPDGSWRQYGAVPAEGRDAPVQPLPPRRRPPGQRRRGHADRAEERDPRRRHASRTSRPAFGGVDPESLESARTRAAMEIRTRYRAVTSDDFEFLCGEASPRVARAVCLPPGEDGMVRVHILPTVAPADRQLTLEELSPDEALLDRGRRVPRRAQGDRDEPRAASR